jgi:hypothetical protein
MNLPDPDHQLVWRSASRVTPTNRRTAAPGARPDRGQGIHAARRALARRHIAAHCTDAGARLE